MIAYIVLSILLSQTNIISWPVNYHFPYRGYGDFNGVVEFHTGLDFRIHLIEEVSVPSPGQEHYVVEVYDQEGINNVIVVLSPGPGASSTGWAYEHLDYSSPLIDCPSQGDVLPSTTTLTTCTPAYGDEPQHVHLARYDGWFWNQSFLVQDSPYNVFMDLDLGIMEYDYPEFTSVENYAGGETGIVFMPDESTIDPLSRESIFGKVDMLVSAVNSFYGARPEEEDNCCVGAIRYRILNWNYYNEQYDVTKCDWRIVYDMLGFLPGALDNLPSTWSDEFLRIYKWNHDTETKFANIQCITNCGTMNSISNCLDNVWVDAYSREDDHNEWKYCRGAWDTRIGSDILANCNDNAYFKDGRYVIELEAFSQRSRMSILDTLPVNGLTNTDVNDNITGIIVDNYYPYISELGLYYIYESDYYDLWSANCYSYCYNDPDNQEGPEPDNYDRYWWSVNNFYLPTSGTYDLAVSVMTSEVAEFNNSGVDLHLETEIGDSLTWETDISFYLDEWDPDLFIPSGTEEGVALYTATSYSMPDEYTGRIKATLTINNIASDLAGNPLDMDPLSWMSPRDTITGTHDMSEWDNTPMTVSHEWGTASDYISMYEEREPPAWIGPDGWIQGDTEEYVVDVYIDEPVYWFDHLIGDCPWLCGFWVLIRDYTGGELWGWDGSIGAYTVDGEGNVQTLFEVYSGTKVQYSCGTAGNIIGCDGQITWLGFLDHDPVYPGDEDFMYTDMYVAACNAENGEYSNPIYLGSGYSWNCLFALKNVGYTELSSIDITPSSNPNVGYTRFTFLDMTPTGDITVQTEVYVNINDPTPVINEITIPCPWQFTRDGLAIAKETLNSENIRASYETELRLPFPNPTMETVNISFTLANSGPVSIVVYDLSGRIVYNHAQGYYSAGEHNVSWSLTTHSGHRVASGMYLILFKSEDLSETQGLVVLD